MEQRAEIPQPGDGPVPGELPGTAVSLRDRYLAERGPILLNGTQALVRLLLVQQRRDTAAGLNTAGFVSGYRGSPIGGLDQQLWGAGDLLEQARVVFQPGVNEDLAATAIWGTQQAPALPGARVDGVYALWYGKGPGVERSGDPVKHAHRQGTARHGGVLMAFGDDHGAKSSTIAHQSEPNLAAWGVPVLYPATVQEILDLGLYGWALSRCAGTWVGLKCLNETLETTATADADHAARVPVVLPDGLALPPEGLHGRPVFDPLGEEARLMEYRLPAVHAFARANRLDRVEFGRPGARLALVSAGKAAVDLRHALALLGLDEARAAELGIALYRPRLIWPLEPTVLQQFARGAEELLVVEEKLPFLEQQVASALFNLPAGERPRLLGKRDADGAPLLPAHGQLDPERLARVLAGRLAALGIDPAAWRPGLEALERRAAAQSSPPPRVRLPYFCAGCPHNTSTRVPAGSVALSGIGCHTMALWMDRDTLPPTQMGGEGAQWTGIAPFTSTPHAFQNLGDGTYAHSGLLAIRAAVASGVNLTYKLLYNDAVAMTGGQPVEGGFSVADIARQVLAEKVARVVVVSDDVTKYHGGLELPAGVEVFHRDRLDSVQRELRSVPGTSVLVYDQACATEKRRRRKRGLLAEPERRVVINHRVCEGCGDCSVQANCVAIVPRETALGRKRAIDQSVCNKDYSCLRGLCPALVTVEGGQRRRPVAAALPPDLHAGLPAPAPAADHANVLVTGIGGTGVVTVGALLAMAAHLDGRPSQVFDLTGLAQKNGAVFSHLRLGHAADGSRAARLGPGEADLLLGCDLVVAGSADALRCVDAGRSTALLNGDVVPTAHFQLDPDADFHAAELLQRVHAASGGRAESVDAAGLARRLLGDSLGANTLLLGYALQRGWLPVSLQALERAIELNGVAVALNLQALGLGRLAAHAPARLAALLTAAEPVAEVAPDDLEGLLALHGKVLAAYQDATLAARHRALVERAAAAERTRAPGCHGLPEAVARGYFKLLYDKDEYEVARLHADGAFAAELAAEFAGDYRVQLHLAPPLFARHDPASGRPRKRAFGPWLWRLLPLLARGRALRGRWFDPFRYSRERREVRALQAEFAELVERGLARLDAGNHAALVELAAAAAEIRGYGPVRSAAGAAWRRRRADLGSGPVAGTPDQALA